MDEKKRCAAVCQKNSPALAALPAPMEKRERYVIVRRPPTRGGHSKVRTVEQLPQKTGKMYWCETPAPQGRALKNQNI